MIRPVGSCLLGTASVESPRPAQYRALVSIDRAAMSLITAVLRAELGVALGVVVKAGDGTKVAPSAMIAGGCSLIDGDAASHGRITVGRRRDAPVHHVVFFFKQKTAYEI